MMEILKEELNKGEKLLWYGTPESFETLDKTYKSAYIKRAIRIISIVAAFCILYIVYALSKGIELKPVLVLVAMGFAVFGSFSYYSNARNLRKAIYAITDQRIINIVEVPKSVEFARIKEAQIKCDEDGHYSLLCGNKVVKSKSHTWRSFALLDPYIDEATGICERFALYAIPDAENVKKILSDYIPML